MKCVCTQNHQQMKCKLSQRVHAFLTAWLPFLRLPSVCSRNNLHRVSHEPSTADRVKEESPQAIDKYRTCIRFAYCTRFRERHPQCDLEIKLFISLWWHSSVQFEHKTRKAFRRSGKLATRFLLTLCHIFSMRTRSDMHEWLKKLSLTEMRWQIAVIWIKKQFQGSFHASPPVAPRDSLFFRRKRLTWSRCSTSNAECVLLGVMAEPFITDDLDALEESASPLVLLLLPACWMMFDEDDGFDNSTLWFLACLSTRGNEHLSSCPIIV